MYSVNDYRWRKAHETEKTLGENFLRKHEKFCVAASARFRTLNFVEDHAWVLSSDTMRTAAMILHSRHTVFPLFNGIKRLELPSHIYRALSALQIHALHGLSADVEELLRILARLGFSAFERMDYYLMTLDADSELPGLRTPPPGITLRRPRKDDIDKLVPLQAAYEREEVLPAGGILDPASSRYNIERTVSEEQALIAELDGVIAGKINTNAQGFEHCQIGGVYVLPKFRGAGIASYMTGAFIRLLRAQNLGITLFVRKNNNAALQTYRASGFKNEASYSIVYM